MAKLSAILQQRFFKREKPNMTVIAEKATDPTLTVFSGLFNMEGLGDKEKQNLADILHRFAEDETIDVSQDLTHLISLTSEIKAINNQAAILHGERIKKAQTILKKYRDGAFTAWLLASYGNRQTPYNFLQYYEFYSSIPKNLQTQLESMPRQAVYTLASREGTFEKKEEIVRNYSGESKQEMISLIRTLFPLDETDKRRENLGESAAKQLQKLLEILEQKPLVLTRQQKGSLKNSLKRFDQLVDTCRTID